MAVRTTSDAVEAIIEVDSTIDLTPFISTASLLVDTHCEAKNSAYTVTELEAIERFLAAHLYTLRDPRTVTENVRSLDTTFQSKVDLGFNTSHYGQMAMLLDWYGGLAALNELMINGGGKRTIGITWLGEESETLEE
jgi:hypothetical protein